MRGSPGACCAPATSGHAAALAEPGDDLPSPHSITSSARARSVGGIDKAPQTGDAIKINLLHLARNLLNGLIDPEQKGRRHFQTKLFSGLQIEMKREPGWLLHRKVAGLGSLEDFDDKSGDLSESS